MSAVAAEMDRSYNPAEEQAAVSLGDALRRTREGRGYALSYVASALNIRASQLEAIEKDDHEKLPGRVYLIGFVRSYAEFLDLDADQAVKYLKHQIDGKFAKPDLHFPYQPSISSAPDWRMVLLGLGIATVSLMGWFSFPDVDTALVADRFDPPALAPSAQSLSYMLPAQDGLLPLDPIPAGLLSPGRPEDISGASGKKTGLAFPDSESAAIPPAQAAPATDQIQLEFIEKSWIQIKDRQGGIVVSRIFAAGEVYTISSSPDLLMTIGNAAGVRMRVGEKTLAPLGGKGDVRRNFVLDAQKILAEEAQNSHAEETEQKTGLDARPVFRLNRH